MAETYTTSTGEEIICQDLTYGFLLDIQTGVVTESKQDVIINGTGLPLEKVMELRNHEVNDIYKIITRLTYPDLFDDEGNEIVMSEDDEDTDKKKV